MTQLVTTTRSILVNETFDEIFSLIEKSNYIELTEIMSFPNGGDYWERKTNININHIVEIRK